ncbi:MAG: HEAT repeat domain-containing protein [Ignavibacteriaceae bacterium]|nr:HEAT repeat domain-containing protein [Ignavibacteriaceae bacterium]
MKNLTIVTVLVLLFQVGFIQAQESTQSRYFKEKLYLQNLITGIQSENTGLRRSAIYLAGKYRLTEVNEALIEAMKTEIDPSTRILIALALYNIGETSGMEAILNFSHVEKDAKVKRMLTSLYDEYRSHFAAQSSF